MKRHLFRTIAAAALVSLAVLSCKKSDETPVTPEPTPTPEPTESVSCTLTAEGGSLTIAGDVDKAPSASLLITKGEDVEYMACYQIDSTAQVRLTGLHLDIARKLDLTAHVATGRHTIRGYVYHDLDSCTFSGEYVMTMPEKPDSVIYGVPEVTLVVRDTIPAEGGTVSEGDVSYRQHCTYISGSSRLDTVLTEGGKIEWGPAVTAPACETGVSAVRLVDSLRVTVTLNGKSGSAAAPVWQKVGEVVAVYEDPVVTLTVKDTIPAGGGTVSEGEVTYSQKCTITTVSGVKDTILTTGGVIEWVPVTAGSLGMNECEAHLVDSLVATVTMNGKSGSAAAPVWQQANVRTDVYDDPAVTLTVKDTIPAYGGEVASGEVAYSQKLTYTYTSGASRDTSLTDGGRTDWSAPVSAESLGTNECEAARVGTLTATVTMNGKSGSASADVYQAANTCERTYGIPEVALTVKSIIPASGGTVSEGTVTYSQSEHRSYASGATASSTLTEGGEVKWGASVTASSLGTETRDKAAAGTLDVSVTMNGKTGTASADVYQAANKAEYLEITPSDITLKVGDSQSLTSQAVYTSGAKAAVSASYTSGSSCVTVSGSTIKGVSCSGDGTDVTVTGKFSDIYGSVDVTVVPVYVSLTYNGPDELYLGETAEYNIKCSVRRSATGGVQTDDVTSEATTSFRYGGIVQVGGGRVISIGKTGTETITFTYAKGNLTVSADVRVRASY